MISAVANALAVLNASGPADKVTAANRLAADWAESRSIGSAPKQVPDHPARPNAPRLVPRGDVKRRRLGSPEGRCALLHAIAHIELNAIDMAADLVARFAHHPLIPEHERAVFVNDWISVCHDEARHFGLIQDRLTALGMDYGDLPAHNGLWEAAFATKDHFAARLAIAPMVLEARGLDVTPAMIKKLQGSGDNTSAKILQVIYTDEIGHVAAGARWFKTIAAAEGKHPTPYFRDLVGTYFAGDLKAPFNTEARLEAGMAQELYLPLARMDKRKTLITKSAGSPPR